MSKLNNWFIIFNINNKIIYYVEEVPDEEYSSGEGCGDGLGNTCGEKNGYGCGFGIIIGPSEYVCCHGDGISFENGNGIGNGSGDGCGLENGKGSDN